MTLTRTAALSEVDVNVRKINDLPVATELPSADELLVPVFMDHTNAVLRSITVSALAGMVRDLVLEGSDVEMIETENGIKFIAKKTP